MWNATIKGLLSHKLRLALTALAIVLGVSFVSGTYVLTDTMGAAFTGLFQDVNKGVDVVVHTKETFTGQQAAVRDPMPESLLATIQRVDGVKVAEGSVNGYAQFVGKNGKAVTTGGAPTLGVSASQAPELSSSTTLRAGQRPTGPGEIAVDARTASKQGFKVGDRVKVLLQGPARVFTISGIVGFGEGRQPGWRDPGGVRPEDGAAGPQPPWPVRRDRRRRPAGHQRHPAPRAHRRGRPGQVRGGNRQRPGQALRRRDQQEPQLLHDGAARLRRSGAVRRGVPDLQHLLDHRRPADP